MWWLCMWVFQSAFLGVLFGVSVVLAAGTLGATVGLLSITCGAVTITRYGIGDPPRRGAHLVAVGDRRYPPCR